MLCYKLDHSKMEEKIMSHEFVKKVFTMEPPKDKETLYTIDFFGCSREYLSIIGNAGNEVNTKKPTDIKVQLTLLNLIDIAQNKELSKEKASLFSIDFSGCSLEYLSIIGDAGSEVITKNPEDLEAQILLMKLVDKVKKNHEEQNIQSLE